MLSWKRMWERDLRGTEDVMEIAIQLGLLALGFVLLVKGADWFVEGAGKVAEKFGIPQLVIGLTIVAMGTSLPEAAVSVSAALKGSAEITIGNVVGSNIMNILLILGLTALIKPIAVQKSTVRYEIPFVIVVSAILMAMGITGDHLLRLSDGLILWALMFCYLGYLLVIAKKGGGLPGDSTQEDAGQETVSGGTDAAAGGMEMAELSVMEVAETPAFVDNEDTECIMVHGIRVYVRREPDGQWIAYARMEQVHYTVTGGENITDAED